MERIKFHRTTGVSNEWRAHYMPSADWFFAPITLKIIRLSDGRFFTRAYYSAASKVTGQVLRLWDEFKSFTKASEELERRARLITRANLSRWNELLRKALNDEDEEIVLE